MQRNGWSCAPGLLATVDHSASIVAAEELFCVENGPGFE
ncbi:unnamed protein product [Ectocarpus sp. 13 AM-2016]